jgi:hypothetical protein
MKLEQNTALYGSCPCWMYIPLTALKHHCSNGLPSCFLRPFPFSDLPKLLSVFIFGRGRVRFLGNLPSSWFDCFLDFKCFSTGTWNRGLRFFFFFFFFFGECDRRSPSWFGRTAFEGRVIFQGCWALLNESPIISMLIKNSKEKKKKETECNCLSFQTQSLFHYDLISSGEWIKWNLRSGEIVGTGENGGRRGFVGENRNWLNQPIQCVSYLHFRFWQWRGGGGIPYNEMF